MRDVRFFLLVLVLVVLLLFTIYSAKVHGQTYITVSRIEKDFYKVHYTNLFIKTRWCYEYATYSEATVSATEDKIFFRDSGAVCDIDTILEER